MPIYPQKCDFGPIFGFQGDPKSTLGVPFSRKKASQSRSFSSGNRSIAIQDEIQHPKWSRGRFFSILDEFLMDFDRFSTDFRQIFNRFWTFFRAIVACFPMDFALNVYKFWLVFSIDV